MIGASNIRQQARFWRAVGREDMIKTDNEARVDDREREAAVIADIIKTKTADEWEVYFQARHVPAARVRTMAEALADPHFQTRRVFHHFAGGVPGIDGPVGVPLAAFKFAHGGPSIEEPPHAMGQDTDAVLAELGYDATAIAAIAPGEGDLTATGMWPDLPYAAWRDTLQTVHLWTQIVGKIRLTLTPWLNHSWHVPFYVTSRGIGTSPIPIGAENLRDSISTSSATVSSCAPAGATRTGFRSQPQSVADFYRKLFERLNRLGVTVVIDDMPSEMTGVPRLFARPRPRQLRRSGGASLLARAAPGRPRLQAVPQRVSRQGQPRAFLLGQLRSRRHPVLRADGAEASRRHSRPLRCGRLRSLFARGMQRRVLAGQRRVPEAGVLLLRLSRADRATAPGW